MSNKKLKFITRHEANDGQVALARKIGYAGIKEVEIQFSDNPVQDLKENGIKDKEIGIVAPNYVSNKLLNQGYKLIEFVNSPIKREKTVFCCKEAYRYYLDNGKIKQERIECPIPVEEQYESSLH